jgi:hypothetical protein
VTKRDATRDSFVTLINSAVLSGRPVPDSVKNAYDWLVNLTDAQVQALVIANRPFFLP